MRRLLSEAEKAGVAARIRVVECARCPGDIVEVVVRDETDINGEPVYSVLRTPGHAFMQVGCKFG